MPKKRSSKKASKDDSSAVAEDDLMKIVNLLTNAKVEQISDRIFKEATQPFDQEWLRDSQAKDAFRSWVQESLTKLPARQFTGLRITLETLHDWLEGDNIETVTDMINRMLESDDAAQSNWARLAVRQASQVSK
jgi:hypothetical protein